MVGVGVGSAGLPQKILRIGTRKSKTNGEDHARHRAGEPKSSPEPQLRSGAPFGWLLIRGRDGHHDTLQV
jgi:hypothetical protein